MLRFPPGPLLALEPVERCLVMHMRFEHLADSAVPVELHSKCFPLRNFGGVTGLNVHHTVRLMLVVPPGEVN
jgi:hypothetical protein